EAALTHVGDSRAPGLVGVDVPPELPPVSMDFALIAQALVNIIDNALKHSGSSQRVDVIARMEAGGIRIAGADHGRGIPEKDLPRIFDKFYSAAPNGTGMGLGLSISKGFVEAHGGSIRAENDERGGAVISFTLPMQAGGAA